MECAPVEDLKKSAVVSKEETVQITKNENEATKEMHLPSGEAKVLKDLARYYSNFSEDYLSVVNGRADIKALRIKYETKKESFPKRLSGLVTMIRSYYLTNLKKIAGPQITKAIKSAGNNSTINRDGSEMAYCLDELCISYNQDFVLLYMFEPDCTDYDEFLFENVHTCT